MPSGCQFQVGEQQFSHSQGQEVLWAGAWCGGRSSGVGPLASGNEFERSELASAAGVSRCSQVGPEI